MRLLYSLAWLVALPFVFVYLLWRSRRQPEYRGHWAERLGQTPPLGDGVIWLHAVSVGETRAAAPLVAELRRRYPASRILLTHTTPTGRATATGLFGTSVSQCYLPYDLPMLVDRFLARVRPQVGIFLETEIWPNLYAACERRRVPIFLVNARLSEKSAAGYRRVRGLTRAALARLRGIAAQTPADASRLEDLGAPAVSVAGNLKFDVAAPPDTAARAEEFRHLFAGRFVVLAASTRDGEEALILDTCLEIGGSELLLVIVPRHPQRFDDVAAELKRRGVDFVRRSQHQPLEASTEVFLGDSMGEMAAYYSAADVAFIGGSLLPHGGQNLIEAAAVGCPLVVGPHTWNFLEATEEAIATGAALRVADAEALALIITHLHAAPEKRRAMAEAGLAFTRSHQGATRKVMELIAPSLSGAAGAD